ncbi:MAG: iron ABC transporter permease [Actinomycetota bacterium]
MSAVTGAVGSSAGSLAAVSPSTNVAFGLLGGLVMMGLLLRYSSVVPRRQRIVRGPGLSGMIQTNVLWLSGGVLLGTAGLALVALMVGDFPIPAEAALRTAAGLETDADFDFIVNTIRFPRLVVAIEAGIALAIAGALFQALIDNPLVSPDIIGINSGAAALAVVVLVLGSDLSILPWAAVVGATVTGCLIYALAWRGGVSGARLVLVGIGVNALLGAAITFVLVWNPIDRVAVAARWQAGSLFGATWSDARTLGIGLALLLPLAFFLSRRVRVLQLGDDVAAGLGVHPERDRLIVILVAAALAAVAVSIVGPLAFVSLLVPHFTRLVAGPLTGGQLLLTGLFGGLLLLGSDVVAQRMFAPTAIPAGIVTAALGGPYFLYLLARYQRDL